MCMFAFESGSEVSLAVGGTVIFVRPADARQILMYSMWLTSTHDVAMILPLPVPVGAGEDAVEFIDLSHYPRIFVDIEACFQPEPEADDGIVDLFADGESGGLLRVVEVGNFAASFVPDLRSFTRLDPRFRLSDAVWGRLPRYVEWGFAVIQLQAGRHESHPIALSFPRRWADHLFCPTVHVHDGEVHEEAEFDHMLYYQGATRPTRSGAASEMSTRAASIHPPGRFVDLPGSRGVVDGALPIERIRMKGMRPNEDVWLRL